MSRCGSCLLYSDYCKGDYDMFVCAETLQEVLDNLLKDIDLLMPCPICAYRVEGMEACSYPGPC